MPPAVSKLQQKKGWTKGELGGLGPDLQSDAHIAAAAKASKSKEFGQQARQKFVEKSQFQTQEQYHEAQAKETEVQQAARLKAERAKQYGKLITKPKVVAPLDLAQYENVQKTPKIQEQREESIIDKIVCQLEQHDVFVAQLQDLYKYKFNTDVE